ncbi:MAG: DUF4214 domain-containing protein [Campylobacterota bacterium]|nr:DUF4214 domain-containing protein [Campylobacterota bacterium]
MKNIIAGFVAISCSMGILNAASQWEKVLDFGPIRDTSISLFDIDNDGKDEIFIGTSKGLDANLNEVRAAALICLEDDGSVKWTRTFPAMDSVDIQTGIKYNTTSVTTAPFFSNISGDFHMEILVGVGGDTIGEAAGVVGQPGDKGGIYALDSHGNILWFHQSLDTIGGSANVGDGRPDGVYGSPIVYDLNRDGTREVIYNGWDQYTWVLDAKSGQEKLKVHMLDTIWSTPKIADINNDSQVEILVTGDITTNDHAQVQTGGIFHVLSPNGEQNIAGFDQPVGNPAYPTLRGKWEEQPLWSSPITYDIDGDGFLEIAYGTGNYFHDGRGEYIKVWNHDGSEKFTLHTHGRTFATPLFADINNDGNIETVAATLDGYIHAWDKSGQQLFAASITANPIFGAPIAVDINNDGKLEIIYVDGAQISILNASGQRVNNDLDYIVEFYKGSPAVKDIDNDGILDLVSGGTTFAKDQAVVRKWSLSGSRADAKVGRYQYIGSNKNLQDFTKRFYREILNRDAEPAGLNYWTDGLITGILTGSDLAKSFMFSQEFKDRNTDDETYLTILYRSFFNREPDAAGFNLWLTQLQDGVSREGILDSFLHSKEFNDLCRAYNIRATR